MNNNTDELVRGHCTTCDAAIIWARTSNGRPIPIDPDPVPNGNIRLVPADRDAVDRAAPRALVVPAADRDPAEALHLSHFVTCPDAVRHRRRGGVTR